MTALNHTPIYNLNAVLHETGVQADVLRAWERRYDLPKPQRTAGGHRLYSEFDIAVIKWLRAQQNEGLSISRAVDLWNQLTSSGTDPLAVKDPFAVPQLAAGPTFSLDSLREAWLQACLVYDDIQAQRVLNQAFALAPVDTVCIDLLQRGIHEMGILWQQDRATVQQEHFTTGQAILRINSLLAAVPPPYRQETLLIACPAGEYHSFAGLLLTLLLRWRGFSVTNLGADTPAEQMELTARTINPNLVLLAAQTLPSVPGLLLAVQRLSQDGFRTVYGGLVFNRHPELRSRIPAEFLGESITAALDQIETILKAPPVFPQAEVEINPYADLASQVATRQSLIDARVTSLLEEAGMNAPYLGAVNTYFSRFLSAALALGDLSLLKPELTWVQSLLSGRNIPVTSLETYLDCWIKALTLELGSSAGSITDWLNAHR